MKVIVRWVVLSLLAALVGFGLGLLFDAGDGADIGGGVLALLAVVVGAFVWALRDGRHAGLGHVLVRWALVGVLVGLVFAVFPQVGSDSFFSWAEYLEDVPSDALYGLVLTLVGALPGALIGRVFRRRGHQDDATTD
ncbi:hypothetical protein KC207_05225 [Phycicoccus sp. BSK3Z-2]|uniref:Uncharacterized protein n=1 Tax=Phycicoccus avicenniae TaxID=2828860 RepID=A0A941D5V7_9MICO|nr:hypothetical protein [Phycicoccus avicenniae]MBR7742689.1 hypothetical protein [Phycicoccus avicenniae]